MFFNNDLTLERLKKRLTYYSDTGIFVWKNGKNRFKYAGWIQNGYIYIEIDNKKYPAHRLAWLYMKGKFPDKEIDHINMKRNDNRICNLRNVSSSVNKRNCRLRIDNTSGHNGVSKSINGKKWLANIKINGIFRNLGRFDNIIDAVKARRKAEIKYNY